MDLIEYLLEGDPSVRSQTMRDLLDAPKVEVEAERKKIATEGWGAALLSKQGDNGLWANGLYSPKWTSTTYTLLHLRRLNLDPENEQARRGVKILLRKGLYEDGGINLFPSWKVSELCVTGMVLSLAAYFGIEEPRLSGIVDYLLANRTDDGGWNCEIINGAKHGSFHTTISVLEGLWQYINFKGDPAGEIEAAIREAIEFLLSHRLYKSDKTGEIVDLKMTRFSFPPRWRYDIMRALDFFRDFGIDYDPRMQDALDLIEKKRNKDGTWNLQQKYAGEIHFDFEKPGKPSRVNTLRALRILKWVG